MRIKKEYAGEDGWSRWVQPITKGYRMQCCDCGLVHLVDFRVVAARAQFRMKRSSRLRGKQAYGNEAANPIKVRIIQRAAKIPRSSDGQ